MHAAVVRVLGQVPRYEHRGDPTPARGETVVDVLAAGLHPVVRSLVAGTHYTSDSTLPFVPGIDGVGVTADKSRVYFTGLKAPGGSMAEHAAVDTSALIPLPDGLDPGAVAAMMNPAVSAYLALRERAKPARGETVLVLGATGCAGRMAVQLAHHGGAGTVIAVGRDRDALDELEALGATHTLCLREPEEKISRALADLAVDVDVVVDYLWGRPTELALGAISAHRRDPERQVRWVQVGDTAGRSAAIPAAHLRRTFVTFSGSGLGSIPSARIHAALRDLIGLIRPADLRIGVRRAPLAEVENAWTAQLPSGTRLVLTSS